MKLLITGANRGLGLALTTEAAKRGHTVFAGVRNLKTADGLKQLQTIFPNQVVVLPLDVGDEASCQNAAKSIEGETLDVIVNNAAILNERSTTIEELDMQEVERAFSINLFGPMRIMKYFMPILEKGPSSSIINISSEAGSFQNAYGADYPYALSKSALNMFSEQLKKYVANEQVSVFAIHPGWIKTDMGGEQAPGSPEESAQSILDIIEKKREVTGSSSFINFKGEQMPL